MLRYLMLICFYLIPFYGSPSFAGAEKFTHGNDVYVLGSGPVEAIAAKRDVFTAGKTVMLKGDAVGDIHAVGFNVDVESTVGGDLYAVGGTVTIRASVDEDISAAGFSVRTLSNAITKGNVRLVGETVTIDGPVLAALSVSGNEVILNAKISNDVLLVTNEITFGPEAQILGTLKYSAPEKITIPERVISPDRVSFEKLSGSNVYQEIRDNWYEHEYPIFPTFLSLLTGFIIAITFMVAIGALFLTFLPKQTEDLRTSIMAFPGKIFLMGIAGLSMLFGVMPVTSMTIIGLPFIPFIILAIIVIWALGYTLGAYTISLWVWRAFGGPETPKTMSRLIALALAAIVIGILNFIPFIGWIVNYTLVLFGVGAITQCLFEKVVKTRISSGASNVDRAKI